MNLVIINAVRIGDRYYVEAKDYQSTAQFRFDDIEPEQSHLKGWVVIGSVPSKIKRVYKDQRKNHRFELIDKSMASDKIPLELPHGYFHDEQPNIHLYSLYAHKFDIEPEVLETVDFKWNLFYETDDASLPENFEYQLENKYADNKIMIHKISPDPYFLDTLTTPQVAIHLKPCSFSVDQTYELIKAHLKANIDKNVAYIGENWCDHLTVKKRISILKPEEYTTDVNFSLFKKRKPKYVKRTRTDRETVIFSMAKKENHYKIPVINGFHGKNQADLKRNVDRFLDELMQFINNPAKDCECCNGSGIIYEKIFSPKDTLFKEEANNAPTK